MKKSKKNYFKMQNSEFYPLEETIPTSRSPYMKEALVNKFEIETETEKIKNSRQSFSFTLKLSAIWNNLKYKLSIQNKIQNIIENICLIRRLFNYTTNEKSLLICANIALIVTSLAQSTMPLICGQIIDSVIKRNDTNELMKYTYYFLANTAVYSIAEFFWAHLFNLLADRISYSLRKEIYLNILIKDMEYFDHAKTGELLNKLNDDVRAAQAICTTNFSSIGRNFVQLIYSCIQVIAISSKLTLCLILIVPSYVIINMIYSYCSKDTHLKSNELEGQAKSKATECFSNMKLIKAFSTEQKEYNTFKSILKKIFVISKQHSLSWSIYIAAVGFLTNLSLISILYIGVSMINTGELSAGFLSSFLLYTIAIASAFQDLSTNTAKIFNNLPITKNLFKLIDEKPKIHPGILKNIKENFHPGKRLSDLQGEINIEGLTFSYPTKPDVQTLKNINTIIKPGEVVALVGASGSGKSSLVSLIQRFYDPDSKGRILIDGFDLREFDLQWLHQKMGFVAQEPALMSGSILENIIYGVDNYTQEKVDRVIKLAHLDFVYNKSLFPDGVQTQVGEKGAKLSGGQKQRIAIARAMMKEPKIVIFDEATSALDAESEYQVQKAIDNLVKGSSHTMLIIAHRLSTILDCERILVFQDGMIKEDGNHEDLLKNGGIYKALFERQLEGFNGTRNYTE